MSTVHESSLKTASVSELSLQQLAEFRYELRRFLSFSENAAEQQGISAQQYQLLQVIAAASDAGQTSITYIAERMVLRHNSAVELVDRAVKATLVHRLSDPSDQRRSLVRLTEHGAALLGTLVAQHLQELAERGPAILTALQSAMAHASRPSEEAEAQSK